MACDFCLATVLLRHLWIDDLNLKATIDKLQASYSEVTAYSLNNIFYYEAVLRLLRVSSLSKAYSAQTSFLYNPIFLIHYDNVIRSHGFLVEHKEEILSQLKEAQDKLYGSKSQFYLCKYVRRARLSPILYTSDASPLKNTDNKDSSGKELASKYMYVYLISDDRGAIVDCHVQEVDEQSADEIQDDLIKALKDKFHNEHVYRLNTFFDDGVVRKKGDIRALKKAKRDEIKEKFALTDNDLKTVISHLDVAIKRFDEIDGHYYIETNSLKGLLSYADEAKAHFYLCYLALSLFDCIDIKCQKIGYEISDDDIISTLLKAQVTSMPSVPGRRKANEGPIFAKTGSRDEAYVPAKNDLVKARIVKDEVLEALSKRDPYYRYLYNKMKAKGPQVAVIDVIFKALGFKHFPTLTNLDTIKEALRIDLSNEELIDAISFCMGRE